MRRRGRRESEKEREGDMCVCLYAQRGMDEWMECRGWAKGKEKKKKMTRSPFWFLFLFS